MKLGVAIKKIVGKHIEKYGFEFDEYGAGYWTYKRAKGEIEQYIGLQKSDFQKNALRLQIWTSAYGRRALTNAYADIPKYKGIDFWIYKDETDLIRVLKEFNNILDQYGLEKLEGISTHRTEIRSSLELELRLYENHEALSRLFEEKYRIKTEGIEHIVIEFENIIKNHKGEDVEEIRESALEMAAYYGKKMVEFLGRGVWCWEEKEKRCVIAKIGPKDFMKLRPLNLIMVHWEGKGEGCADWLLSIYKDYQ